MDVHTSDPIPIPRNKTTTVDSKASWREMFEEYDFFDPRNFIPNHAVGIRKNKEK